MYHNIYFTRLQEPDFVQQWTPILDCFFVCGYEHTCTMTQDAFAFCILRERNHAK